MSSVGFRPPPRRTPTKFSRRTKTMSDFYLTHCQLCNTACTGVAGLANHYRSSPRHPTCPRCGTGFFDRSDLETHAAEKHPRTTCCGLSIAIEDLEEHYFNSMNHMHCDSCEIGFKEENDLREHNRIQHSRHTCTVCDKDFSSADELKAHRKTRGVHVLCEFCNGAFKNTGAMIDHYANTHLAAALNDEHSEEEAASIVALSPIRPTAATSTPERFLSMPTARAPLSVPSDSDSSDLSLPPSPAVVSDLSFLSMSGSPAQLPAVVAQLVANNPAAQGELGLVPSITNSPLLFLRSTPPQSGARRAPTPAETPSGDLSDVRNLAGTPMRAARISPLLRPQAHVHEVLSESEEEHEQDDRFHFVDDEDTTEDETQELSMPDRRDSFFEAETPTSEAPRRISFLDVGGQTPVAYLPGSMSFFDASTPMAASTPTLERGPILEEDSEAERPSPSRTLAINVAAARAQAAANPHTIIVETDSEAEPGTPTPSPRPLPGASASESRPMMAASRTMTPPTASLLVTPPRSGETTPPTATWRADTPPTATFGSAVWAGQVSSSLALPPSTPPKSDPREEDGPPASRMSVQSPRPAGHPSPPLIIPLPPSAPATPPIARPTAPTPALTTPVATESEAPSAAHVPTHVPAPAPILRSHSHAHAHVPHRPGPPPAYAIPLPPSEPSTPPVSHAPYNTQYHPSISRGHPIASSPPGPHAPIPRQGVPHAHSFNGPIRSHAASPPSRFMAPTPPRSHPSTPPHSFATIHHHHRHAPPPAITVPLPPSAPVSPPLSSPRPTATQGSTPPSSPRPRAAQVNMPINAPRRVSTPNSHARVASPLASPPISASGSPTHRHANVTPPSSVRARSASVASSRVRSSSLSTRPAIAAAESDADDEQEVEIKMEHKRSPFFCRSKTCTADPCVAPTVTACGHIFCHSCIDREVRATAHCPQCGAAQLLFALLRLDLSDA
ncbi:unnamed protein product [Peniophora sp. CBMAI 1063]|nr:unnamed protein product [Peniophora sp. CBMAI 1063]